MGEREDKNKIQCIVDEGVLANRRDMVRILRDLGHVHYEDLVDGHVRTRGEGYVANVCSNPTAATVFVNKRLYINVNGFDYMKMARTGTDDTAIELVDDRRTIRLLPSSDGVQDRQAFIAEGGMVAPQGALERMLGVEPGEAFYEEDLDESDEL